MFGVALTNEMISALLRTRLLDVIKHHCVTFRERLLSLIPRLLNTDGLGLRLNNQLSFFPSYTVML